MTQKISIAFYNLENFFDTYNDPLTDDDAFKSKGIMHWIKKRFSRKSKKIAYTIKYIGWEETTKPPTIIGLAEVENKRVLKNIVKQKYQSALSHLQRTVISRGIQRPFSGLCHIKKRAVTNPVTALFKDYLNNLFNDNSFCTCFIITVSL